jgi:phosphoglycerate dehydrogenase-like enzyme
VVVTNSRGLHANSMAEHALGLIFAFARKLHLARDAQARRDWMQERMWTGAPPFRDVAGATLGLVGLGAIGSALAARARALGMKVIAVRRRPAADPAPADAQWGEERLEEMLGVSDFVVLAPPLTPQTQGMITRARLSRMRPHAILINLGRGALVDETALIDALERGALAGAGLDVTEEEPLPPESPLWAMPNVIMTPHVSGLGPRYWERAMALFSRNLRAFVAGAPLENVVNKREGY